MKLTENISRMALYCEQASGGAQSKSSLRVMQIREYIKEHFDQSLDIGTLATRLNICPSYFFQIFRDHTGCSPIAYLTQFRIERACDLLYTTNLGIKTIAVNVGYDDPQYFSRVFKKLIGRPPKEYRRMKNELR
jgi:YesN/AraC family two-component response regulator